MYDFKLANRDHPSSNGNYPMCSLVKYQGFIQFIGTEYILQNDFNPQKSIDKNKTLIIAKEYSQAVFDNYTYDFYYFTYNNISDFVVDFLIKQYHSMIIIQMMLMLLIIIYHLLIS